jgi:Flp pilus assembly protein TadG
MTKFMHDLKSNRFLPKKLGQFLRNTAGSTSLTMALAALPVIALAGAAIDMARASREKATFYASVDAAALAIASDDRTAMAGLTSASQIETQRVALENYAKQYILVNYKKEKGSTPVVTAKLDLTGQNLVLDAKLDFPTTMMGLFGIEKMTITAKSEIAFAARPLELTMVMDTTGSMASNNKLTGAKEAARKLLDVLYGGTLASKPDSEFIRVALVPFAGGVRLNPSAFDFSPSWIDTTGANPLSTMNFQGTGANSNWNNFTAWGMMKKNSNYMSWTGCVEARKHGAKSSNQDYHVNDVAPTLADPDSLFPAYFAPDAPSSNTISTSNTSGSNGNGNNGKGKGNGNGNGNGGSGGTTTTGTSNWTNNYGPDYIKGYSLTTAGSECNGLTAAQCTGTSDTVLFERQRNYQKYQDADLTGVSDSPDTNCASSKVVPMTYSRQKIDAGISAMQANGNTLIAEGLAWGLRTISPGQPFTKVEGSGSNAASTIAPYDGPRWRKIMVLMTDGDNFMNAGGFDLNDTAYSAYGYGSTPIANNRFATTSSGQIASAMDTAMLDACERIKGNGIDLYVTSFGDGVSTASRNRLKACSSGEEYYTHAATTTALVAFFDHIGKDVLNKSIYVAK